MAIFEDIKKFFEPKPQLRARDILREIPSATVETGKEILRDFPRSVVGLGLKAAGKEKFVPESEVSKFLLGEKPVEKPKGVAETGFAALGAIPPILPIGRIKAAKPAIEAVETVAKERKFLQTVRRSEQTSKELKTAVGEIAPAVYEPITNKQALFQADQVIIKGPDIARKRILSTEPVSAEKSALAIRLSKKYENEGNIDAAVEIIESYDKQLREAGRFVQAASLWNKLSPAGLWRTVEKTAEKTGTQLSLELKQTVTKAATEIQKLPEGPERDKASFELLNYVAEQFPQRFGNILDAYRYQNMLSNPRTQERNIYSNLFQTFITKPTDLFAEATYDVLKHPFNPAAREAKFKDVPLYIRNVITSIPNALTAFKEGFRQGRISEKIVERRAETAIEALRATKVPAALTIVPRFMEATDRLFSVMIGTGEKARLMAKGIKESEAQTTAAELAEKYLFRERLGGVRKTENQLFVAALDGLGNLALKGRNIKGIGTVWGWFVPFVTTPINIAKEMVKRSPVGFVGRGLSQEQQAKVFMGTAVTGMGALLALQEKTTWTAPTDSKAKELFYATGRKPFAVKVGDKWVPMWYFGPYSLALALPAAVRHFYTDTKEAPTDNDIARIGKAALGISRFITSQTPLSGIEGFVKVVEGDIDYSLPGQIAFMGGQFIPFSGLVRYVNTILDPIYRKSSGFTQAMQKDLPIISQSLPAFADPSGNPAKRDSWNYFLPYDVGGAKVDFEPALKARIRKLQVPKGTSFKLRPIEEYGPSGAGLSFEGLQF